MNSVSQQLAVGALLLLGLGCRGSEVPQPESTVDAAPPDAVQSTTPDEPSVEVLGEWKGRIQVPMDLATMTPASLPPRAISDQQGYADFVGMIPTEAIQMKQPAPPSDDPLLTQPAPDFATAILLVAFRTDSMYIHPELQRPRLSQGELVVDLGLPELGETVHMAAQEGIGTYHALLVRGGGHEVEFRSED